MRELTRQKCNAFNSFNSLLDQLFVLYRKIDLHDQLTACLRAKGSRYPSERKKLEAMLTASSIAFDPAELEPQNLKASDNSLSDRIDHSSAPDDFSVLGNECIYALYKYLTKYPGPEDSMLQLVNDLSMPEDDGWKCDPLRLRILKQFIKYGDYLSALSKYASSKNEIQQYAINKLEMSKATALSNNNALCAILDDGVFSEVKCNLLTLSEDLASGRIRSNRTSRQGLYLFAIVYRMTYNPRWIENEVDFGVSFAADGFTPDQESDIKKDIEKNLFYDYYTNNLLQYLGRTEGDLPVTDIPSEYGINYKNFAEMIYLYYIVNTDYEPWVKIKKASNLIDTVSREQTRLQKQGKKTGPEIPTDCAGSTIDYRRLAAERLFTRDNLLGLEEGDLKEFILNNYSCVAGKGCQKTMLGAEENSPYKQFLILKGQIELITTKDNPKKSAASEESFTLLKRSPISYVRENPLYFVNAKLDCDLNRDLDCKWNDYQAYVKSKCGAGEFHEEIFQKLREVITFANHFLASWVSVDRPDKMSRTALLSAFYYATLYEIEDVANFPDYFYQFRQQADMYLIAAGYQPISGNNLFDVLIALSGFLYAMT
jgi:hypothetical protein